MKRPLLRTAVLAVLALAVTAPLHAGPGKAVKKAKGLLQKNAEAALKDYGKVLKARRATLTGALDAIDAQLKAGLLTSVGDVDDLFQALVDFQSVSWGDWQNARADLNDGVQEAFAVLVDAAIDVEDYPADFQSGTGGRLDRIFEDFNDALAKACAQVRKRAAKTVKLFRNAEGIEVVVRLDPALELRAPRYFFDGTPAWWQSLPWTIDVMVTASDVAVDDDGVLFVAGTGWGTEALEVRRVSASSSPVSATMRTWRWSAVLSGLPEGNDQVLVQPIGGIPVVGIARAYCVR